MTQQEMEARIEKLEKAMAFLLATTDIEERLYKLEKQVRQLLGQEQAL